MSSDQVLRLLISGEMPVDRVAESPSPLCDNCTRASSWAVWSRALFRSWSGTFSTAGGPRRVERPANGWCTLSGTLDRAGDGEDEGVTRMQGVGRAGGHR